MKAFVVPCLIVIYAAWQSLGLFDTWVYTPLEKYSWLILLIWLAPLFYCCVFKKAVVQPIFLWFALISTFLGAIGSLNALKYIGLSLALAGFVPFSCINVFWILGSISWMPAFGWIGSHFLGDFALFVRFLLVSVVSFLSVYYLWKNYEK